MPEFMHMPRKLLLTLVFFAAFGGAAQAAAVSNLTDSGQLIQIKTADGWKDITIAPGDTWRVYGLAEIRFRERESRIEHNQEFAIWPNGDFGPQRQLNIMHKGF